MKVLLIHAADENGNAGQIRSLLEKIDISFETLFIKSLDERIFTQFTAFFSAFDSGNEKEAESSAPTHVLILSPVSKRWFDFYAGFSSGSHIPFIVYGQEIIAGISEEFASCFTFSNTSESLQSYFETENDAFKKQEDARKIIRAQETLLRMGIPVTGESLAQCAAEGRINEIALFLTAGFSADTRNKEGVPLLNVAARKINLETVRFLINAGAQCNLQAEDRGTSALIDSVMVDHIDLVEELVKAGTDLNIKSKDGQTALIVAVGAGNEKIVEILIKAGADTDISDSLGVNARKYAVLFHKEAIIQLFDTYAPVQGM